MNQEFNGITSAVNRLERIQNEHIESFQTQVLPDLEAQTAERKKAFDSLIRSLDMFFTRSGQDEQTAVLMRSLTERIQGLQNQNRILKEKVETYREDLKARMKHLAKARKGINAYRPPSSFSNRPRAISLTN